MVQFCIENDSMIGIEVEEMTIELISFYDEAIFFAKRFISFRFFVTEDMIKDFPDIVFRLMIEPVVLVVKLWYERSEDTES